MVLISRPRIVAHRGASGVVPENTLLSIATAMASRADIIEIDVQLTKDERVVLFHDQNLKRIVGVEKSISDLDLSDLLKMDIGIWKHEKFSGLHIPTLEEVLDFSAGYSLIIEIKPNRPQEVQRRDLETKVLELLDDSSGIGNGYISVRDLNSLKWFQDHDSRYRYGLMQKKRSCDELFNLVRDNNIKILQIRSQQFSNSDYQKLPAFKVESYVYWGDSPNDWQYLSTQPIQGILTNYPALMRGYFLVNT